MLTNDEKSKYYFFSFHNHESYICPTFVFHFCSTYNLQTSELFYHCAQIGDDIRKSMEDDVMKNVHNDTEDAVTRAYYVMQYDVSNKMRLSKLD